MPDDVEKEIEDMLSDLGDTLDIKSDSSEDTKDEQEIETSVETEEEEVVETEEVAEVVEGEEEKVEEPELTAEEIEAAADEIEKDPEVEVDMEAKVKELEEREKVLLERIESVTAPAVTPTQPAAATPEFSPAEPAVEEVKGFLDGLDIDEVVASPEKLEKVLKEVQRRTEVSTTETVLRAIPQLIISQVQQQNALRDAAKDFYEVNNDLAQVKQTVGAVANEVQAEHPDWSLEQIFEETAPRTRKLLGMKESAKKVTRIRKPALVKTVKSSQKPSAPDLSGLEKDVADTIL